MNCPDVELWLQEQLDGTPADPPSAIAAHLAGCTLCRERHQAARLLETGLHALTPPVPPLNLTGRIVAAVQAQRRWLVWRYRLAAVAAAAAVLLLLPLLGWLIPGNDPDSPILPQEQAQVQPPPPAPEEIPDKPGPSLKDTMDQARQALAGLTGRVADQTQKQAQLLISVAPPDLPPMDPVAHMTELDTSFDPAAQSLREVTANVGTGLHAVTSTAQQAVNYFAREIPPFRTKTQVP